MESVMEASKPINPEIIHPYEPSAFHVASLASEREYSTRATTREYMLARGMTHVQVEKEKDVLFKL